MSGVNDGRRCETCRHWQEDRAYRPDQYADQRVAPCRVYVWPVGDEWERPDSHVCGAWAPRCGESSRTVAIS